MSILTDAYTAGFEEALQKFAATRAMKEIRKSFAQGTPAGVARADMIAKTPGVLSSTNTLGTPLKHLGAGAEGLASVVAHPQHGVSVRKMFDPQASGYAPELIARKAQLGSLPGAAAHYGSTQTMHGTPVHFNEYVQGSQVQRGKLTPQQMNATQAAMTQTSRALRKKGYRGMDIRDANMMMTPSGEAKVVDYLPYKEHETLGKRKAQDVRRMAQSGQIPAHLRDALTLSDAGRAQFKPKPTHGFDPSVSSGNYDQFSRFMTTGDVVAPSKADVRRNQRTAPVPPSKPQAAGPQGGSPSANAGWSQMLGPSQPNLPASAPTSVLMPPQQRTMPLGTPAAPAPGAPAMPQPPQAPASRRTGLSEFL